MVILLTVGSHLFATFDCAAAVIEPRQKWLCFRMPLSIFIVFDHSIRMPPIEGIELLNSSTAILLI